MKKLILLICSIILMSSLCLCVDKQSSDNYGNNYSNYGNSNYYNNYIFMNFGNNRIKVPLRTTVGEALSTQLINTNDTDIRDNYLTHRIIYFEYNESIPNNEGGVSITDLIMKLKFFNQYYPHILTDKSIFNNTGEIYKVKSSNKTIVIKIIRGSRNATIEKYNNSYIIEGNSLKELDKAESRFIIAICGGNN